jgi:predicted nucleic acid-binding protein
LTARTVLDASAAVHLVMKGEHAAKLSRRLKDVAVVIAPELYCSEVANSLLKYIRASQLTVDDAVTRFERCMALVGTMIPEATLASEALVAASKSPGSVYDMMYAVLARRSGATVITMDRPFALRLQDMDIGVFCPLIKV